MKRLGVLGIGGFIAFALVLAMANRPRVAASDGINAQDTTAGAGLSSASGKRRFLRVNDLGGSFGGCPNCITAEVVFNFTNSNNWYGLRLQNDSNLVSNQGALDLLRDAFNNNWTVEVDYSDDGLAGRTMFPVAFGRVTLSKP